MSLSNEQITNIEQVLKDSLRNKFLHHKPEPASMPFHTRLLGKDRLALYSFIHSLNTNFGTTIFEPVGLVLAQQKFKQAWSQRVVGDKISSESQRVIQTIIDKLNTAETIPDKNKEIQAIREVCQKGVMVKVKPTRIDLMIQTKNNELFLFDIKTAKPNAGGFKEFKRTLLEWVAVILASNPTTKVNSFIAIPYNPYEPEKYNRWTMCGMLDLDNELKVASEFWDFLGGVDTYQNLLDCFERVGIELRNEIDTYFKRFSK